MRAEIKKYRSWLEEFLVSLDELGYADNTVKTYNRYLKEFFKYIEGRGLNLREINGRVLRAFFKSLSSPELENNGDGPSRGLGDRVPSLLDILKKLSSGCSL